MISQFHRAQTGRRCRWTNEAPSFRLVDGDLTSREQQHGGFSLLEVLVAAAIVVLLIGVLLPSLAHARRMGKQVQCLSNQRQIAMAMHAYVLDYGDSFPMAQYFDQRRQRQVMWDVEIAGGGIAAESPGLIWEYTSAEGIALCPEDEGDSKDRIGGATGYNYNVTYLGRGENEGAYLGMGFEPARLASVRHGSRAALIGDGGWSQGVNRFMRAPGDDGVAEATVHAGGQSFRHGGATCVVYIDVHGAAITKSHRKPGARPMSERVMGLPANGFLSSDDRAYAHR